MKYHERTPLVPGDPTWANHDDRKHEDMVFATIERVWGVDCHRFGQYDPIDGYAIRDGHTVGYIEVKYRDSEYGCFPHVWLNLRKFIALTMMYIATGTTCVFVVAHNDGRIHFIDVKDVDAHKVRMGGTRQKVKSHTDQEPVIEIPLEHLRVLVDPFTTVEVSREENLSYWPEQGATGK